MNQSDLDINWGDDTLDETTYIWLDGEKHIECSVRIGRHSSGKFLVDNGDEHYRDVIGTYSSLKEARKSAQNVVAEEDCGNGAGSLEEFLKNQVKAAEAKVCADGEYGVAWRDPDSGALNGLSRYPEKEDASIIVDDWYRAVYERTPNALVHLMRHPVIVTVDEAGDIQEIETEE